LPQLVWKNVSFPRNSGRTSKNVRLRSSLVPPRLSGPGSATTRFAYDLTNPNNLIDFGAGPGQGRGANDQPQAFKLLGSYQAAWGINIGANYQALSGLPRDRTLTVPFAQGSRSVPVEERGTYRYSTLNLLSLRADKGFRFGGRRASVIFEVHNVLNSNAVQNSVGNLTQSFANQAAFDAARKTTSYFGRAQEIVAPRVLKLGFKFDF